MSAIGFAPFLVIYLLVHTRYVGPWLPRSREADLLVLLLLPATWFAAALLQYWWLAPAPKWRAYGNKLTAPKVFSYLVREKSSLSTMPTRARA